MLKAEKLAKQRRKKQFVTSIVEKMINSEEDNYKELKILYLNHLLPSDPSLNLENFSKFLQDFLQELNEKTSSPKLDEKMDLFLLTFLGQLLFDEDYKFMFFLMKVTHNNEKDDLLENIFNFCCSVNHGRHLSRILEKCVIQEVESTLHYGTCFRSNSTASKLSKIYSNQFTNEFITKSLKGIFTKVIENPVDFEIDPLKAEARNESFQKNCENVENIIKEWLDEFLSSPDIIPYELRLYSKFIYENVAKKFPQVEDDHILSPCHIQIGGFIFLRVLCPAFLTPEKIGIKYEKSVNPDSKRFLIIITKIIQNLANGIVVNEKEVYMDKFIDMIKSYMEKIKIFYEKVIEIEPKDLVIDIPNIDSILCLQKIHKYFMGHLKEIQNEKHFDLLKDTISFLDKSDPIIEKEKEKEEFKIEIEKPKVEKVPEKIERVKTPEQKVDSPKTTEQKSPKQETLKLSSIENPGPRTPRSKPILPNQSIIIPNNDSISPRQDKLSPRLEKPIEVKPQVNPNQKSSSFNEEHKSGYLQKFVNGVWKWFYCVIQGAYLLVFTDHKAVKELENVLLKGLEVENLNDEVSKKMTSKEYSIRLTRPKEKSIYFGTLNAKDFFDWGIAFKEAGARYSKNVFIVDKTKKGPNIFSNIQDAVLKSDAFDVIQVAPGTYTESVVINRPIHIVGSEQSQLKGSSNSVFTVISHGCSKIVGFNLAQQDFEYPMITLKGGTLILSKMKISGSKDSGIRVLNNAQLIVKKCSISNNSIGILLRNESFAYLEMSDVSKNHGNGLEVTMNSLSMVKLSKFVGNEEQGIKISSGDVSSIEKCIFQENSKAGVYIFPHNCFVNKNLIVEVKDNVFIRNKEKNLQLFQKYDENIINKINQFE